MGKMGETEFVYLSCLKASAEAKQGCTSTVHLTVSVTARASVT